MTGNQFRFFLSCDINHPVTFGLRDWKGLCLPPSPPIQILMWRGKDWKSMFPEDPAIPQNFDTAGSLDVSETLRSSPKLMCFWKRAIELSKTLLLDEINLGPDELLKKVEEFENISEATKHSYPVLVLSGGDGFSSSMAEYEVKRITVMTMRILRMT